MKSSGLSRKGKDSAPPKGNGSPNVKASVDMKVEAGSVGYNAVMGTANANGVSMSPGSVRKAVAGQKNKS